MKTSEGLFNEIALKEILCPCGTSCTRWKESAQVGPLDLYPATSVEKWRSGYLKKTSPRHKNFEDYIQCIAGALKTKIAERIRENWNTARKIGWPLEIHNFFEESRSVDISSLVKEFKFQFCEMPDEMDVIIQQNLFQIISFAIERFKLG